MFFLTFLIISSGVQIRRRMKEEVEKQQQQKKRQKNSAPVTDLQLPSY